MNTSDDGNQTLTYEVYSNSSNICGVEGILLGVGDMHKHYIIVIMILTYKLSLNQVPQW